jgi:hypothetical protein
MLLEELTNIDSSRAELRRFGLIMAAAAGVIGGIAWWTGADTVRWWLIAAAVLLCCSLLLPVVLWPFQKLWMAFAVIMGHIMTRVILALLFYLVVTPLGLTMRLLGKDPLMRRFDPSAASYWIPREPGTEESSRADAQF